MSDYSTLAQRVSASASGIRGCLLLNRDGLVLGADPEDAESHVKAAWIRFAAIGEPDRSYVEFPDQIWAYVRRGSYAAFAVSDVGVRPGVLVDVLEQTLMAAEQERALDRDTMRVPDVPAAPSGKPRTSLHVPAPAPAPAPAGVTVPDAGRVEAPLESEDRNRGSDLSTPPGGASLEALEPSDALDVQPEADAGSGDAADPEPEPAPPVAGGEDEAEVDRILLAKEFAGLLQVPKEDDDTSR
jgi:hypothetical protein